LGVVPRATAALPIVYSNIKDQPINQAMLKIKVSIICMNMNDAIRQWQKKKKKKNNNINVT